MSKNDIKAMFVIMAYVSLIRQGYLKIFAKELEPLVISLKGLYPAHRDRWTHARKTSMLEITLNLDDTIEAMEMDSTVTFILGFIMGTAEEFYKNCHGNRKIMWGKLIDYCMQNELIQHILKKRDYSEIERSAEFVDTMFKKLERV